MVAAHAAAQGRRVSVADACAAADSSALSRKPIWS
jgi:hypothetical protein